MEFTDGILVDLHTIRDPVGEACIGAVLYQTEKAATFPACLQLLLDQRVDAYLATFTWRRKVSQTGQICIGGSHHYYTVGRASAYSEVFVRFDPADRHFVFYATHTPEQELGRRPARYLKIEDITGLITFPHGLLPQQITLPLFQQVIC